MGQLTYLKRTFRQMKEVLGFLEHYNRYWLCPADDADEQYEEVVLVCHYDINKMAAHTHTVRGYFAFCSEEYNKFVE